MFKEYRTVPVTVKIHKLELESDGEDVSHIEKAYEGKVITLEVETLYNSVEPSDDELEEALNDYISDNTDWLVSSVAYEIVPVWQEV